MSKKGENLFVILLGIVASAVAIGALKLVFDNDRSRIVSKEGRKALDSNRNLEELKKESKIVKHTEELTL